jgi:putative DNA primase/helicase
VNYDNYGNVLLQLQAAGLVVDDLVVGSRQRVRCDDGREKRGWYHLHEMPMEMGRSLLVGSFGVWRGNDNGAQKIQLSRAEILSDEQRAALRERIAADRKAAEAARKREIERAAARAYAMWHKLSQQGESEYLQRKGVAPHGVRFAESGAMVLPLLDAHGKIYGLQAIYPRGHEKIKRTGRDKDFWPAGLQKQGHFFLIGGSPASAGVCMLAEGYATGATVYQAVGLPVAVGFDAGNLVHVAAALRARYPQLSVLVLADDDYLGKCRACGQLTLTAEPTCSHCGEPHQAPNAGIAAAQATALADRTSWLAPRFAAARSLDRKGPTDWNDLHLAEGLHVVRAQIEAHLTALKWRAPPPKIATSSHSNGGGEGGGERGDLTSVATVDELHERFALVYEAADVVFDAWEHKLVPLASMRNLCTSRQLHRAWMESIDKRVVRLEEVGFDPSEQDTSVKCNLWAGWPTRPRAGACEKLLELGEYLCSLDDKATELWRWLQCWLAYPVQHPGAKMKTAVIMHGPQGTGKNLFFEAVLSIYGTYGQVVDQDAIEDKHNDFMSRKLMLVADEVVARMEMFHAKNKLKGLVTSDWISINPKFVARYRERNHCQIVFLSNEIQPMALERDDRRYAVIWTPTKWVAAMYNAVLREIEEGGVAALHDHLLRLNLGDFGPATLPPMTEAKEDLIELGMDSSERFWAEWTKGYLPLPVVAARSEDLYAGYRHWSSLQGVNKPAQLNTCVHGWAKRPGARKERERHFENYSHLKEMQSQVIYPPGVDGRPTKQALTDSINTFNEALRAWKKASDSERKPGPQGSGRQAPPAAGGDDDAPY